MSIRIISHCRSAFSQSQIDLTVGGISKTGEVDFLVFKCFALLAQRGQSYWSQWGIWCIGEIQRRSQGNANQCQIIRKVPGIKIARHKERITVDGDRGMMEVHRAGIYSNSDRILCTIGRCQDPVAIEDSAATVDHIVVIT